MAWILVDLDPGFEGFEVSTSECGSDAAHWVTSPSLQRIGQENRTMLCLATRPLWELPNCLEYFLDFHD